MNMKVILNKDLSTLGEEGDVKEVAKGYARNFLLPRGIALPYTDRTVKLFETRRDQIEARKAEKRKDAAGIREKLEALELVISMPAGANGKLYGAVTTQTVMEELARAGHQIERKRLELPGGGTLKAAGKYKVSVKLYGSEQAEVNLAVEAVIPKVETKSAPQRKGRSRRDEPRGEERAAGVTPENTAPVDAASTDAAVTETAPVDAASTDAAVTETAPAETVTTEAAPVEAASTDAAVTETAPADAVITDGIQTLE
jgi:large subunit ribosomal protein L9